jgi:hypothetical protein
MFLQKIEMARYHPSPLSPSQYKNAHTELLIYTPVSCPTPKTQIKVFPIKNEVQTINEISKMSFAAQLLCTTSHQIVKKVNGSISAKSGT